MGGTLPRVFVELPTPAQFDGFEEVALPDVEEEEEPPKDTHSLKEQKKERDWGPESR